MSLPLDFGETTFRIEKGGEIYNFSVPESKDKNLKLTLKVTQEIILTDKNKIQKYYLPLSNIKKIGGLAESYLSFGNEEVVDELHSVEELEIINKIYTFTPLTIDEVMNNREIIQYYCIDIEKIRFLEFEWDEIIFSTDEKIGKLLKSEESNYISFKMMIGDGMLSQDSRDHDFDFSPLWFSISDYNNILFGNNLNTLFNVQDTDIDESFDFNHSFIRYWSEQTRKRARENKEITLFGWSTRAFAYPRWCSQINFRMEFCRKELDMDGVENYIFESDLENNCPLVLEIPHPVENSIETRFYSIDPKGRSYIPLDKTEDVMNSLKENDTIQKILEKFKNTAKITDRRKKFFEDVLDGAMMEMKFNVFDVVGYVKVK